MATRILITGGAGFIGSHLSDQLLAAGHEVRVLDSLSAQVHGARRRRPRYLSSGLELLVGDVRDAEVVTRALEGVDRVCHLAAVVGIGHSMYHVDDYASVNSFGTAVLLQALLKRPVERLVVASSASIYGEGCLRTNSGVPALGIERTREQLRDKDWEVRDSAGERLIPCPTPETKAPAFSSVYGLSKFDQERVCMMIGRAYQIPTIALRFFNVFGPRQALSNPYAGVLAIFAARLLNGNAPLLFEDGEQRRDFVSVHDAARACRLALESPTIDLAVLNIGSGHAYSVREVAVRLAQALERDIAPELADKYRVGDVRHCFADVSLAQEILGYAPNVGFDEALAEFVEWLAGERPSDYVSKAHAELISRGLAI
jgi:dTDP-L-rhamnose 4-epimerase